MKTVIMFLNDTSKVCLTAVGQSTAINVQNRGILMNTTWPTDFTNWTRWGYKCTTKHLVSYMKLAKNGGYDSMSHRLSAIENEFIYFLLRIYSTQWGRGQEYQNPWSIRTTCLTYYHHHRVLKDFHNATTLPNIYSTLTRHQTMKHGLSVLITKWATQWYLTICVFINKIKSIIIVFIKLKAKNKNPRRSRWIFGLKFETLFFNSKPSKVFHCAVLFYGVVDRKNNTVIALYKTPYSLVWGNGSYNGDVKGCMITNSASHLNQRL